MIEDSYRKHDLTICDDIPRAAWATFHGDSVTAWPTVVESGYDPNLCESNERYVCLPELSRHALPYAGSHARTEAWTVLNSALRGRRPFITENGYMGLTPAYVVTSDCSAETIWSIAVLAGCSTPVLLQERDDGTYRLVGTCFVQG
jgi:hypothetical protein